MRRALRLGGLAALLSLSWVIPVAARGDDSPPDLPDELLVIMSIDDASTRVAATAQLRGLLGDDVQMHWMLSGALAETWETETFDIRGPDHDRCDGEAVGPKWLNENGEIALHLVDKQSTTEAREKAEEVEANWACLDSVVTPMSLLRTTLVRGWIELQEGDSESLAAALKQAAAIDADEPESWVEQMPAELWELLADFRADVTHQPPWDLTIDTDGLAIDAFVDGTALEARRLDGSARRFEILLPPGDHLLQIVRPGPRTESAVVHLGPDGGTARVSAVTPVTELEALDAFDRGVMEGQPSLLLQDLLSSHKATRSHDHVVLAHMNRAFGVERLVLVPLVRTSIGHYARDDSLDRALAEKIEKTTRGTRLIRREQGPPGEWRLWFGGGGGVSRIQGYFYAVPCLEIGLETPQWISAFVRPLLATTREDHTFMQGGGAAVAAFTPRIKRLRLVVGFGGEIRAPDHRFDGLGIHPIVHGGVGVRIGQAFHLSVTADTVLYRVRDSSVRLTWTYEVTLRKKRSGGFEVLQKEEAP